ncbi:MAG: DUF2147 domain-containing protein [Sphingomonadales bacterium]|nr:DUF2147 domain-containing protein [Sphingomonadales bacterium]
MICTRQRLLALCLPAMLACAAPALATGPMPEGLWRNPRGDVEVAIAACGGSLCGTVAWAGQEAQADAREAGTPRLIGTPVLKDYRPAAAAMWQGEVFVPDIGRTFFSRIQMIDADHLRISGCLLHGLICKAQTWTRAAPHGDLHG